MLTETALINSCCLDVRLSAIAQYPLFWEMFVPFSTIKFSNILQKVNYLLHICFFLGDLSMHFNVWNISLRFSFCVFISFNPLEYPCSIASYALFECHPEGPRDYIFFSLINSGVNKCNSHSLWNDQRTKNTTVEKECQKATDHILQCAL